MEEVLLAERKVGESLAMAAGMMMAPMCGLRFGGIVVLGGDGSIVDCVVHVMTGPRAM